VRRPVEVPRALGRGRRRTLATGVALVLALALSASGLAGCTSARNGLGTHDSSCFRALPAARAAVGTAAIFAGVRSLPASALVKAVEAMPHASQAVPPALTAVLPEGMCLVAFKGNFAVDRVPSPWAPLPGPYRGAVVVVRFSNVKLVTTVLVPRLPRSIYFSDLH